MVHPPGILLILTPFTWLANLTSDSFGFYAARIFFILIGAVSTYLIYRIGRKFNRTAGVIAALIYAVWMPVVRIERTPYLEGIGSLALLIALYLLPKSNALKNRVAVAGLVLGFAVATKLWFAVPVVIILLWLLFAKQIQRAIIFGATSLAMFLLVIAPFWYRSGNKFWQLIFTAQLNRGGGSISSASRIDQIFNFASFSFIHDFKLRYVIGIILVTTVIVPFMKFFRRREQGLLILILFIAQFLVLLKTPVFFNAYPSFAAATFALIAGISLGEFHRNLFTGSLILLLIGVGVYGSLTQAPGQTLPTKIEQLQFKDNKCVTSDSPAVLALINTLSRDIKNNCHLLIDVTGTIYGIDNGANPYHRTATTRRLRSDQYQKEIEHYLLSGSTIILAREREDGIRPETLSLINQGHTVTKTKSFVIIS